MADRRITRLVLDAKLAQQVIELGGVSESQCVAPV
jgi:hypothetical protein